MATLQKGKHVDLFTGVCLIVNTASNGAPSLPQQLEVDMRLPKSVYEVYPVLYVISGICAMSLVDSLMSFMSGLILGFGGVGILFLRRNYRATKQNIAQVS